MLSKRGLQAVFLTDWQKNDRSDQFFVITEQYFDILTGAYPGLDGDIWLTQNRTECNI